MISMGTVFENGNFIIPSIIFYIICMGLCKKISVYDVFIEGSLKGLKTAVQLMPTLIGLMVGVGILSSSGFIEDFALMLANVSKNARIPVKVFPVRSVPVAIVRMFSNSAATGLVLDIFRDLGPDSYEGILVSLMMCSTETIFYTMSVYFSAVKVKKTRWTLPGALIASFAGMIASVVISMNIF